MARASGADPVLFDLEEVEALAARCGKCEFGEQCLLWHLEAPDDAPGPPSYCLNREWIVATRAKQRG